MAKVIGIDLGTTNSCLAISENGQTKVIENAEVHAPLLPLSLIWTAAKSSSRACKTPSGNQR